MPHLLRNLPLISIPTNVPAPLPQRRAGAVQEETGTFKNSTAKTSSSFTSCALVLPTQVVTSPLPQRSTLGEGRLRPSFPRTVVPHPGRAAGAHWEPASASAQSR